MKDSIHVRLVITGKRTTFFKAFVYAWNGIKHFFLRDRNGRFHLGAALAAVLGGFVLHINMAEWFVIMLCIGLVIAFEMINAAIEKLCDIVHKDFHPTIKTIKDISAGAVLWVAVISFLIGTFIFFPKILILL